MSAIGGRIRAGAAGIAGAATGAALVLALVAGLGAFAVTAVPRVNARVQSSALHRELSAAGANAQVVTGTAPLSDLATALYTGQNGIAVTAAQTALPEGSLRTQMSSLGIPLAPGTADYWSGAVSAERQTDIAGLTSAQAKLAPVKTALTYRGSLAGHATLIAGSFPDHAVVPTEQGNGQPVVFDVAISQATATQFSLRPHDIVSIAAVSATFTPPLQLDIVGIFKPADAADEFWDFDNLAAAPVETLPPTGHGNPYWSSDMFIGPDEVGALQYAFTASAITLQYCLPVDLSNITGAQALPLANLFNRATSDAVNLPQSSIDGSQPGTIDVALATGPSTILNAFVQQSQAVGAVMALVFGSLTALGAAVLLLCVLLLAERRAAEFALLRARGAAARQLAALGGRVGAAAAIPAAAGALLAIVVVRGPVDPWTDWRPTGVIVVAALLGPALLAVRTARRGTAGSRGAGAGARTSTSTPARGNRARRIVAHVAVNVVCVGSVLLERAYGASSGNLLTSTAPFLLAVPIALVLYYTMPYVIRVLTRVAARRRGVVSFVGLARASRGSIANLLPSFALVLALAVLAVGTMVHDTVTSGEQRGSWAAVGADDLVASAIQNSSLGFSPAILSTLSSTPGVARSATAALINTNDANFAGAGGSLPNDTMVVVVDPARFNALVAGTPVPQLPVALVGGTAKSGTPIPVVASPSIANLLENGASGGGVASGNPTLELDSGASFPIHITATQTAAAELPGAVDFMIVPSWGLGQYAASLPTNLLMLDGPIDNAALRATAKRIMPGATITSRADALNTLTTAPFQSGTFGLLDLAMLAAVLLAIAVLLANLALGAASREATLARLATMGLSRGQSNRLILVENVPSILGALLGGAACTVAIGALVGAGIDLSVFTGTGQAIPLSIDPWTLTAAGAAIAATAVLTLAGHTMAAHRRGVTASLRVGEQ